MKKYVFGYYMGNYAGRNTVEADCRKDAERLMQDYIESIHPGRFYDMWLEVQLTVNANRYIGS